MKNIKNIIFDYGNVIFKLDFAKGKKAWKELGIINPDQFYGHTLQDRVFDAFERGEITAGDFRTHIRLKVNNPDLTDQQIDKAWNSMLIGVSDGNHDLLIKLKSKYRTFLLSNINAIHYEYIINYLKTEFNFDGNNHLFEKTYYSHLTGKRKPELAIFEQLINENNLDSNETLFIDDSPQHIEGAAKLGLQTYLLTAPDNIQQFFSKFKVV